jgi:hypothetical protein
VGTDGDVCFRLFGRGTGASMVVDSCFDELPAGALSGGRGMWSETTRGEVWTCAVGVVHEDVGAVELHFPHGPVEQVEVLSGEEIGADAYYATCWEGEPELSTLVMFDEDGRELGRSEYGDP